MSGGASKPGVKFSMGFDEDISADEMDDMESPDEADNDDDDFDANELMNFNSY